MTALATDNFNRANSTGMSNASWTTASGANASANIVSNEAACVSGDICSNYYNAVVLPNAQYVKCVIGSVVETVTDNGAGPMARMATGAQTGYLVQGNTHETRLYKAVAGAFTQLGSDGPAVTTGDVLEIDANGTSLTVFKNGTAICGTPVTDSSITSGNGGFWLSSPAQQISIDNWEAGNFAIPGITTVTSAPLPPLLASGVLGPLGLGGFAIKRNIQAAPNVTVTLTGQSATFATGTMAPSTSIALVGRAATFAVGTVIPNTAVSLTGRAGTFASGTLLPSTSVGMTGQSATFATGVMSTGGDVTVGLTGQAATFSAGILAPNTTLALSGGAASFTAGNLLPATSVGLTGNAMTSAAGTMTASTSVTLAGLSATFSGGLFGVVGDVTVALTGLSATFTAGQMTPQGDIPVIPSQGGGGGGGGGYWSGKLHEGERKLEDTLTEEWKRITRTDSVAKPPPTVVNSVDPAPLAKALASPNNDDEIAVTLLSDRSDLAPFIERLDAIVRKFDA